MWNLSFSCFAYFSSEDCASLSFQIVKQGLSFEYIVVDLLGFVDSILMVVIS